MKDITAAHKFLIHMVFASIRHPRQPIVYSYCPECQSRLPGENSECPKCGKKATNNPGPDSNSDKSPVVKQESPIPWYGSVGVIALGVAVCVIGSCYDLSALDRVGDALVFIPLGRMYGMSRLKD
jgi:hypothetical protein